MSTEKSEHNNVHTKLPSLTAAFKEFSANETKYSLKKNLLELCDEYAITPQELFDFIEETDIEHEQTTASGFEETRSEDSEDKDGNSIHTKEITDLAEVVDELPPEERVYPPGWTK